MDGQRHRRFQRPTSWRLIRLRSCPHTLVVIWTMQVDMSLAIENIPHAASGKIVRPMVPAYSLYIYHKVLGAHNLQHILILLSVLERSSVVVLIRISVCSYPSISDYPSATPPAFSTIRLQVSMILVGFQTLVRYPLTLEEAIAMPRARTPIQSKPSPR